MDLFTYQSDWNTTPDKEQVKKIRQALQALVKPGSQWAEFIKTSSDYYRYNDDMEIGGVICEVGKDK